MQIIQNLDILELFFTPNDNVIQFKTDSLRNKKIQAIYIAGMEYWGPIYNPPKPNPNLSPYEISTLGLYLNVYNQKGKQLIKELSVNSLNIDYDTQSYIQLEINDFVDFDKSHLFYKSAQGINRNAKLRVFVAYQTNNFKPFDDTINGSQTIFFSKHDVFSPLDKFINHTLRDKFIKKIHTDFKGGIYIKGKEGQNLDLISQVFFSSNSPKEFYLDPLLIDYEKSTIYDRTPFTVPNFTHSITFFY